MSTCREVHSKKVLDTPLLRYLWRSEYEKTDAASLDSLFMVIFLSSITPSIKLEILDLIVLLIDQGTLSRISLQIWSILTSCCDDSALSMVDGLEEHGDLCGLESWRRIFTDQKGTLNQRVEDLRTKVLYPERVKAVGDVMESVTKWEAAYVALTDAWGAISNWMTKAAFLH